jgi:hypothetical protein
MGKWLALGLLVVTVAWGPYVYTELGKQAARPQSSALSPRIEASHGASESQLSAARADERAVNENTPLPLPSVKAEVVEGPEHELAAVPVHDDPGARARAFRKLFDEEPRDSFWANDQELGLRGAVQSLSVPAAAIGDVACRRTVCRITFSAPQLESELESRVLIRMQQDFSAALLENHDVESDKRAMLYVLRSGYTETPARAAR